MDDAPLVPEVWSSWFVKAEDDLRVASLVLKGDIGVEWAACFHAQQAAEKAIKGLLARLVIDFPNTHSLERLVSLLPSHVSYRFDIEKLTELTPWAVAGRYPEDIANPAPAVARTIVTSATEVVSVCRAAAD